MTFLSSLFGDFKNKKFQRCGSKIVNKINKTALAYEDFEESDYKAKTAEFKQRIASGENPEKLLPEAFALVKSASEHLCGSKMTVCGIEQQWDMVHYNVQLLAGYALWKNMVAEIATGEGKTLIATLPIYMYALFGRGCHVATVNEYLAKRDCEWMGNLYSLLGLTCACVYSEQSGEEKKAAYAADITYGTSSEFGFDYLRDNSTAQSLDEKVQRGFFFCLVDEADSILIDEARTPLIISGYDSEEEENPFKEIHPQIRSLVAAQNKLSNRLASEIQAKINAGGILDENDLQKLYQVKMATPRNKILKQILQKGVVNIAFEELQTRLSTGFSKHVLHALKEGIYYVVEEQFHQSSLTGMGQKFLSPENPDAFTLPDTESIVEEIERDSSIDEDERARRILTARAELVQTSRRLHSISQLLQAYSLYERDIDYIVTDGKVEIIDPNTGRVMQGRRWSDGLHQAVEAKEGVKIERENRTYATISIQNYFRMYERLAGMTGTAKEESQEFADVYKMSVVEIPTNKPCARKDLEDLVFLTRREKYLEVMKLISRARERGQPVLVGTSSVEDSEVLSRMLKIAHVPHNVLNAKNNAAEARIVADAGLNGQITIATNMAGRGTDIKLGNGVNELGGLLIIASDHHNSPRVDRQLMGRCARQGDNGTTIFVVSLEDDLLRLHADISSFQNVMKNKHVNGVAFVHPLFKRIIKKAQSKVEGEYSSSRKEMLKFDNPANKQRAIVYSMRDEIIAADDVGAIFERYLAEQINDYVFAVLPAEDLEISKTDVRRLALKISAVLPLRIDESLLLGLKKKEISKRIFENVSEVFSKIFGHIPAEIALHMKRGAMLSAIDTAWRNHISRLEELRSGIYLRSYAQKDPYCEFEKEAFDSFNEFVEDFRRQIFSHLAFAMESIAAQAHGAKRDVRRAVIR